MDINNFKLPEEFIKLTNQHRSLLSEGSDVVEQEKLLHESADILEKWLEDMGELDD